MFFPAGFKRWRSGATGRLWLHTQERKCALARAHKALCLLYQVLYSGPRDLLQLPGCKDGECQLEGTLCVYGVALGQFLAEFSFRFCEIT